MAIPKTRATPIIIINTNTFNVWVRQPLLAVELYDAEYDQIEYRIRATMDWEGENIKIRFYPVPPQLLDINSCQVEVGPVQPISPEIERPEFGPRPDTGSTNFDFKSETDWLPFQLNIGKEANST